MCEVEEIPVLFGCKLKQRAQTILGGHESIRVTLTCRIYVNCVNTNDVHRFFAGVPFPLSYELEPVVRKSIYIHPWSTDEISHPVTQT